MNEILKSKGWTEYLGEWKHPSHNNMWITFNERTYVICLEVKHCEEFAYVDSACVDLDDMRHRMSCLLEYIGQ